jgi:hypothetical protein
LGSALRLALALFAALVLAQPASAAVQWNDGTSTAYPSEDCQTETGGIGSTAETGFYADPNSWPKIGDVYYVRVVVDSGTNAWAGAGNCDNYQPVKVQILLPRSTQFAVSSQNPIKCLLATGPGEPLNNATGCPTSPQAGTLSGYHAFNPSGGGYWPVLAGGGELQIWVPVFSTQALTGAHNGVCGDCLTASIDDHDGFTNTPYTAANGIFVNDVTPSVSYASPATTNIANTSATTGATITNAYRSGSVYFDLGTSSGTYTKTQTGAAPTTSTFSTSGTTSWTGLAAGTKYYWRARFISSSGTTYTGSEQSFTTTTPGLTYTLTVTNPDHSGYVTSPSGINCGSSRGASSVCSVTLPIRSTVTLTANPSVFEAFAGWSGACTSKTPQCTLTIRRNLSVTAAFTFPKHNTSTGLASSRNPAGPGDQVVYTTHVTPVGVSTSPPSGTVRFTDNGSTIGGCDAVAYTGAGGASCTTSYPSSGSHQIVAAYSGDANFNPSSSSPLDQVIETGAGPPPTPPDTTAPRISIRSHPAARLRINTPTVRVSFRFTADDRQASFRCRLDSGRFSPCRSPKRYRVRTGRHTFWVEAVDAAGDVGTARMFKFRVVRT